MDNKLKVESDIFQADASSIKAESIAQNAPVPPWHAPVITRIDIKRTMSGAGSNSDTVGRPTA